MRQLAAAHYHLGCTGDPDPDCIQQAIQLALCILDNASAQFSQEPRSKALAGLNPDLKPLVEDEDFSKSAPFLFGPAFEKKAKERFETITCLRKAANAAKKRVEPSNSFFLRSLLPVQRQPRGQELQPNLLQESQGKDVFVEGQSKKDPRELNVRPSAEERHLRKDHQTMNVCCQEIYVNPIHVNMTGVAIGIQKLMRG